MTVLALTQAMIDAVPAGRALVLQPWAHETDPVTYVMDAEELVLHGRRSLVCLDDQGAQSQARICGMDADTPPRLVVENCQDIVKIRNLDFVCSPNVKGTEAIFLRNSTYGPNTQVVIEDIRIGQSDPAGTPGYEWAVGSDDVDSGNDKHELRRLWFRYCDNGIRIQEGQHTSWILDNVRGYRGASASGTFLRCASNVTIRNGYCYGYDNVIELEADDATNFRQIIIAEMKAEQAKTFLLADAWCSVEGVGVKAQQVTSSTTPIIKLHGNNSQQVHLSAEFTKGGTATTATLVMDTPNGGKSDKELFIRGRSNLILTPTFTIDGYPFGTPNKWVQATDRRRIVLDFPRANGVNEYRSDDLYKALVNGVPTLQTNRHDSCTGGVLQ